MVVSTAVILAAGRGIRLGNDFRDRPKGSIEVGSSTFVERSAAILRASGIRRVLIVTGHCADFYDQLAIQSDGLITTLFNEHYADFGSLVSLQCALRAVSDPFLILDSDIIYEARAISNLLSCKMENAALVSGATGSGDEYYAWADDIEGIPLPTIRCLSKRLSDQPDPPLGEHVGIVKIGNALADRIRAAAALKVRSNPKAFYEDCLIEQLQGCPMGVVRIDDLIWCEVDDVRMLERAQRDIFPRLDPIPGTSQRR